MKKNTVLREAIFNAGFTQRSLARQVGVPESYLSMACHGKYIFDEVAMKKISIALGITL